MRRSSIPYLFRRGDWFYFRAAVPKTLRARFGGKAEIKIGLGTSDPRVARLRCRHLSNAFERFLEQVGRMTHLSVEQVQGFARQYFQERLNEAYELADDIPTDPEIDPDFEIAGLKEDVEGYRKSLSKRQYGQYPRPWRSRQACFTLAQGFLQAFERDGETDLAAMPEAVGGSL